MQPEFFVLLYELRPSVMRDDFEGEGARADDLVTGVWGEQQRACGGPIGSLLRSPMHEWSIPQPSSDECGRDPSRQRGRFSLLW